MTVKPVILVAVDRRVAAQAATLVEPAGVGVMPCPYGPDTIRTIAAQEPPLVVADLARLPGDGEILCHHLSRLSPGPLLLAIVRADVEAAVKALDRGAVACLSEPVEPKYLAKQIVALLRLANRQRQDAEAVLEVGGLIIDRDRCLVIAKGKPAPLTPTEFRILSSLARAPGRVIPPSQVMFECVGLSLSDREAIDLLKVHIYRLRRKLKAAGASPEILRNARGFGYLLERRAPADATSAVEAGLLQTA